MPQNILVAYVCFFACQFSIFLIIPFQFNFLFTKLVYKGCWVDSAVDRDLSGVYADFTGVNTPDKCFAFCSDRGYKYPGLQNE